MAKFLEGNVEIDTSSMTTEELKKLTDKYQRIVDTLKHEFCVRKMCEHKHQYSPSSD